MQDLGKPSGRAWRPRDWDANRRKAWAKDRHRALGCPVGQEGKLGLIAKAGFGVGNVGHGFGSKWGRKGEPRLPSSCCYSVKPIVQARGAFSSLAYRIMPAREVEDSVKARES